MVKGYRAEFYGHFYFGFTWAEAYDAAHEAHWWEGGDTSTIRVTEVVAD